MQGGSWRLLGVQLLACLLTAAWGVLTTVIMLFAIEKTVGIRLTREEELQGCDLVEHGIGEEDEEEDKEEVDTDAQTKRISTFRGGTNGLEVKASEEGNRTGSFCMTRLPIVARILRRKDGTRKPLNNEPHTAQLGSVESSCPATAQKNDEDPQTSPDCNRVRVISAEDARSDDKHTRGSDDLRSISSMESDIEELLRGVASSESCYPMTTQKRRVDKCVQVACK